MRVGPVDASETSELRRAVLRPSWPVGSRMHGDDEPDALHIAAVDDGMPLCACVLFPRPYPNRSWVLPAWQLRGMATAPAMRGQGIGAVVLAAVVDALTARGARLLWCEAREAAVPFYECNGFRAEGAVYIAAETGLPHRYMWRELSAAPTSS